MENRLRMVGLVGLLAAIAAALTVPAAADGKTLPADQLAAGWIRLFDGETLFGWNALGDADWRVENGNLTASEGSGGWLATGNRFGDFELTARLRIRPGTTAGVVVRGALEGHPSENGSGVITILQPKEGESVWRQVVVRATGDQVAATVDGMTSTVLNAGRLEGHIGFQYHHHRNVPGGLEVTDVRLRPLNLQSIFNGEDLTGWHVVPGHPAKVSVIEGALNVRDGRGQLETEALYKDFVLQLEIISHGDHLNSGVFFRGPVGTFWRGYESQIRNQWEGDDRTRPVDFGTGGVYGNQPAREVVSSDYEWFHKTILCVGNQITVWVNGYMVADFFDTRPIHPQADGKFGYVADPGTIHLQGHDPGTNLSFRNIRIQDLSRGE